MQDHQAWEKRVWKVNQKVQETFSLNATGMYLCSYVSRKSSQITLWSPCVSIESYAEGSWEFAARSIYYDGLYQQGLHSLAFWMEVGKNLTASNIVQYTAGLKSAATTLDTVLTEGALVGYVLASKCSDVDSNQTLVSNRRNRSVIRFEKYARMRRWLISTTSQHSKSHNNYRIHDCSLPFN